MLSFLDSSYLTLKKEYSYWMDGDSGHVIQVGAEDGEGDAGYTLNRYFSGEDSPRPESYAEDYTTASGQEEVDEKEM